MSRTDIFPGIESGLKSGGVSRLLKLLRSKRHQVVFFVGAGISSGEPSCLPLWDEFVRLIMKAVCDKNRVLQKHYSKICNSSIRPEVLLQWIYHRTEESALEILHILDIDEFNPNHLFLAHLLSRGHIKSIITTNFDHLIEDALRKMGFSSGRSFVATERSQFKSLAGKCVIFKPHGTVDNPSTILVTVNQIGLRLDPVIARTLNSLMSKFAVVFVGYRGADLDIQRMLLQGSTQAKEIFWNLKTGSTISQANDLLFRAYGKRLHIMANDIEKFFPYLARNLNIPFRTSRASVRRKRRAQARAALKKWTSKIEGVLVCLFVADILEHIGEWEAARECNEYALVIAKQKQDFTRIGATYANLSLLSYRQEEYDDAIEYGKESLKAFQRVGSHTGAGGALGNLGLFHMKKGNFRKSKNSFLKALDQFKMARDNKGIAGIYTNLGILHTGKKRCEEALSYLNEGHKIKMRTRPTDVDAIATSYIGLGGIYLELRNYSQAISKLKRSLDLFKEYGDIHKLANAYVGLGIAYQRKGMKEVALEHYLKAKELAEDLNDENVRKLVDINMTSLERNGKDAPLTFT